MAFRLYQVRCPFCLIEEEQLCDLDKDGLPVMPHCTCEERPQMERVFTPITATYSASFWSHDRPRRIEVGYTDAEGKRHRMDVTHKLDTGGSAPGTFDTKDD